MFFSFFNFIPLHYSCSFLAIYKITVQHAAVSSSIPGGIGIFNKLFLSSTRRDGGVEFEILISVPNIPVLNPKFIRSEYEVKAYVGLMLIIGISFDSDNYHYRNLS